MKVDNTVKVEVVAVDTVEEEKEDAEMVVEKTEKNEESVKIEEETKKTGSP